MHLTFEIECTRQKKALRITSPSRGRTQHDDKRQAPEHQRKAGRRAAQLLPPGATAGFTAGSSLPKPRPASGNFAKRYGIAERRVMAKQETIS